MSQNYVHDLYLMVLCPPFWRGIHFRSFNSPLPCFLALHVITCFFLCLLIQNCSFFIHSRWYLVDMLISPILFHAKRGHATTKYLYAMLCLDILWSHSSALRQYRPVLFLWLVQ